MNDHQVGEAIAIEIADPDQPQVAGCCFQVEGQVGGIGVAAAIGSAVDADPLAPTELDEIGPAIAIEITGELGELADPQIVEIEAEFAREVEPGDGLEAPVIALAPEVEIDPEADPMGGENPHRLEHREIEGDGH